MVVAVPLVLWLTTTNWILNIENTMRIWIPVANSEFREGKIRGTIQNKPWKYGENVYEYVTQRELV